MWANQLLQLTSITMALCNIWMLLEDKSNIIFTIIVVTIGVIIGIIYVQKDLQVRKLKYNVWLLQQNHLLAERTIEILKKEKEYLQTMLSACERRIDECSETKNVSEVFSNVEQFRYENLNSYRVPDCSCPEATSDTQVRAGNSDSADTPNCLVSEVLSENHQPKDGNSYYANASECLDSEAKLDDLLHRYDTSKYSDIRRTLMNAEKTAEIFVKPNTISVPETSRETTTACGGSQCSFETQKQNHKFKPELDKCSSVEDIITCAVENSKESTISCECSCCSQSRSEVTQDQSVQCHSNLEKFHQTQNSSTINPAFVMSKLTNKTSREADTININTKKSHSTHGNTSRNLQDLVQTMCSEFLDDLERQIGRDHPDFASMLENLAKLHHDAGRFAEAEKFLTESLTIREKASGKNTREFLAALNTLASMYYAQKRYEESAPLYKLALEIQENILGGDHIDLAKPLRQYAFLCQKLNKLEESEQYLRKALRVYQSALGPNCKSAVKIRSDLIACLKKMKNSDSAKQQ